MPKQVKFEGRVYTFPDDATEQEIREALETSAPAPARMQSPAGADRNTEDNPQAPSAMERFGSSFFDTINPLNALKALPAMVPYDIFGGTANADATAARLKAQAENPFTSALANSPLGQFGGANAGQRIGEGDVAGGLGEGLGQIAANTVPGVVAPRLGKVVSAGARRIAKIPINQTVRPSAAIRQEFTPNAVADAILDERVFRSNGGVGGTQRALERVSDEVKNMLKRTDADLLARDATALENLPQGEAINPHAFQSRPIEVGNAPAERARLRDDMGLSSGHANEIQNMSADFRRAAQELTEQDWNPLLERAGYGGMPQDIAPPRLSLEQAQRYKQASQDVAYDSTLGVGPRKEYAAHNAKFLKDYIEAVAPEVGPLNKRTQNLMAARQALAAAEDRPTNLFYPSIFGGFGAMAGSIPGAGLGVLLSVLKDSPKMGALAGISINELGKLVSNPALLEAFLKLSAQTQDDELAQELLKRQR